MSVKKIAALYKQILEELGALDCEPSFLGLEETPMRVAKMLVNETLAGYKTSEKSLLKQITCFPAAGMTSLVVEAGIPFSSLCAHHCIAFSGTAAIGYLPGSKLVGLSKLPRILDYYAARLQMQERLGAQVADFMMKHIDAQAAFVLLKAEHSCMSCRGIKKAGVSTVTATYRPLPPDDGLLTEFYRMADFAKE